MKAVVFVCFIASSLAIPNPVKRIVNGSPVQLFSTPHQVSLQVYKNGGGWMHICGGTIISITKVLTAAHCLVETNVGRLRVQVGVLDLDAKPIEFQQTIAVSSYIRHEDYQGTFPGLHDDIGIITLSEPVELNANVKLAEMAPADSSFDNTKCVITGWGLTSGSAMQTSPILLEVKMTKISTEECQSKYPDEEITSKHTCVYEDSAPDNKLPSACMGDSGGPMMCGDNFTLLNGITSFGLATCDGTGPSVYTRVPSYLDWINARI